MHWGTTGTKDGFRENRTHGPGTGTLQEGGSTGTLQPGEWWKPRVRVSRAGKEAGPGGKQGLPV